MSQQQLQQNVQWTPIQQLTSHNQAFKGKNIRLASGICLVVTGIIEIIIAIILLRYRYVSLCGYLDRIAWGIWAGVLAITTGCFGCFSRGNRCVVITFLVLSIINAVISAEITILYGNQTACGVREKEFRVQLALYILMFIILALQLVMSIIGASFTCPAICPSNDPMTQQLMVNQPSEIQYQTAGSPNSHWTN